MLKPSWSRPEKSKIGARLSKAAAPILGWCKWSTRKPSVLVVDDDPDICPLVKVALDRFSISTDSVSDTASAIQRLRVTRYDLVILDLCMPDTSGFEVLLTLKKGTRLRKTPVIVLTSNDTDEALARSFGYGADDFVLKPFHANELGMRAYRLLYPLTAQ